MGRHKVPTEVLKKRGSKTLSKRKAEVKAARVSAIPVPPGLRADAVDIWHLVTEQLDKMNVLAETDSSAVLLYCNTYAKYVAAEKFIEEKGTTYERMFRGEVLLKPYPQAQQAIEYGNQLAKFGARLGLSPADRANLRPMTPTERKADKQAKHFANVISL